MKPTGAIGWTTFRGLQASVPCFLIPLVVSGFGLFSQFAAEPLGNLSPADALKAFETEPGFTVELVAAEPLVVDPVALAFDEHGRLYVAENRDYPLGAPDGKPAGVVALLEDTDGDGRMDKRTEFATGIGFPNGVMCWRGGVIVTAAPDVLWLADSDGDGRADQREVLLSGFSLGGSSQLRVNDPTLGPDGLVYFAGGLSGGFVFSPKHPEVKLDLGRGDVRLNPDTGEIELTDGKSQFGLAFDDAGNRFACMNRVPIQHAPLPAKVLARNPAVASPGALQDCPEMVPNRLLVKHHNSGARLFPISGNVTTADSHEGTYSAACAVHIYRGTALPAEYHGAAFSCDPTANLVRGDRLVPVGGSFAAQRLHEGTEALRSRDNWFRPVFLADGPDGALYIADMYRGVIEHPVYLPDEVRKRSNFDLGKDKGRIWRLRGSHRGTPSGTHLVATNVTDLVNALAADAPWKRDTAARLLRERMPAEMVTALLAKFPRPTGDDNQLRHLPRFAETSSAQSAAAAGRSHALNLLAAAIGWTEANWAKATSPKEPPPGLEKVRLLEVVFALIVGSLDESPVVRQTAFRYLGMAPGLSISDRLVEHWSLDPNPTVRLQVAVMLGHWDVSGRLEGLGRIALLDGADKWTRAAILSGLKGNELHFLDKLMENPAVAPSPDFMFALGRLLDGGPRDLGQRHWTWMGGPGSDWKFALWAGVAEGFRRGGPVAPTDILAERFGLEPKRVRDLNIMAAHTLADSLAPLATRLAALRFLGEFPGDFDRGRLLNVVTPDEPLELQRAAVTLACRPGPLNCAAELLGGRFWAKVAPAVQAVAVAGLLSAPTNHLALIAALEQGVIRVATLLPAQREQLRKSPDETVRRRAEALFAAAVPGDRKAAFEAAKASLTLKPMPANGHAVFTRLCAGCHRFNREGVAVGPDLFDIRNQAKETILLHLVIPEQEVAPQFQAYDATTTDGRSLTGLLGADGAAAVTLRQGQGLEETIPRRQLKAFAPSALSLMPQELEKAMTGQEMADLLAYLRGEGE
jgi:putative membrane-bound dehydrogenase-like protein